MKTQKGFRNEKSTNELRKAKRLEPMVKSGKERYHLYRELDDNSDDDSNDELITKQKSILDYFDDNDDDNDELDELDDEHGDGDDDDDEYVVLN